MSRMMSVTYVGGPLDGEVNSQDYARHELEEMLAEGYIWDYTPTSIYSRADPVIERYQIKRAASGQWLFQHIGTVEQPVLERPITATFVGGPRAGQTTTFLGSIRDRLWLATSHHPGYLLSHSGDDPLTGWQMVPTDRSWEQLREQGQQGEVR
ncbi:hypothetical protein [Catellatospora sp. NPDC049133]|uniref:hypothetical protein n=1 Tax=Catellatospora sp. NPDC049133 TaxID=3155499 RepID=UPI0033D6721F